MDIEEYFAPKSELYDCFVTFIDDPDDSNSHFKDLIDIVNKQKIFESKEELKHLLKLILSFANNYPRKSNLISKTEKIIINIKDSIKQSLSKIELYNLFESNKLILLLLIENKIIEIDQKMCDIFCNKIECDGTSYGHFFYPEVKKYLNENQIQMIEADLLDQNLNIFDDFEVKRKKGENGSYIASLIRQDSVEDFIQYITKSNIPLNSVINSSVFETNPFLIAKKPSLIEYATFYGSIEIFQYLKLNEVELTDSLWFYAIHSNTPELIHLLEENHVEVSYIDCLEESIKCNLNSFAKYFENNYVSGINYTNKLKNDVIYYAFHYYNYKYYPKSFKNNICFAYAAMNKYNKFVNDYLKSKSREYVFFTDSHNTFDDNFKNVILHAIRIKRYDIVYFILTTKYTCIPKEFLYKNWIILSMCIPPTIASIKDSAFKCCRKLTHISIPSSIIIIESNAFKCCSSLEEVVIPSSVIKVCDSSFEGCKSLQKVVFEESSSESSRIFVLNRVFACCIRLKSISLSSNITEIGYDCFSNCSSLEFIRIPSSVQKIGIDCFLDCVSLKEIIAPDGLQIKPTPTKFLIKRM